MFVSELELAENVVEQYNEETYTWKYPTSGPALKISRGRLNCDQITDDTDNFARTIILCVL